MSLFSPTSLGRVSLSSPTSLGRVSLSALSPCLTSSSLSQSCVQPSFSQTPDWKLDHFLAAPAPDFFSKRLRIILPSGSGFWYFSSSSGSSFKGQEHATPCQSFRNPGMMEPTIPDRSHICRQFFHVCRQFRHLGEIVCKSGLCLDLKGPAFGGFYRTAPCLAAPTLNY